MVYLMPKILYMWKTGIINFVPLKEPAWFPWRCTLSWLGARGTHHLFIRDKRGHYAHLHGEN